MEEFDLKKFAKLAWAKKIFIILIMIVSLGVGYFYSYMCVIPKYRSTTSFLLAQLSDEKSEDENQVADLSMTSTLIQPYISLLGSKRVVSKVIDNLGLNMSVTTIKGMMNITQENQAMIVLSVSNENAELAETIAKEIAKVFVEEAEEIFKIENVNIIDAAERATSPYNINHPKDLIIFGMLGAFLSCGLILLIYMLDTTVKEEEDLEEIGLPILGTIPVFERKLEKSIQKESSSRNNEIGSRKKFNKDNEIVILDNAKSPVAEAFRALRTNVTFAQNTKTILITSSRMGEGKSYVAANLAATIAKTDKKVIIVDADMRKGRQNKIFGLENKRGLSNYLANCEETKVDIGEVTSYIKTTQVPNLHLMTSGSRPSNPAELLSAPKIKGLLSVLGEIYDIIIIDGTPSSIIADSVVISRFVDYSMLVTAYKTSKTEEIKKLIKTFEQVGTRLNGAVLNKYPLTKEGYTSSYYYSEARVESKLVESSRTEIRTVENFLADANINTNSFRYVDMKDANLLTTPNAAPSFKGIDIFKGTVFSSSSSGSNKTEMSAAIEYKIEKIDSELAAMKNMLMQVAVNTNQVSSKDIELIRFDISNLKQSIDDIKDDDAIDELKEELMEMKNITEELANSQANNNEKIKKFIEDYYKQKAELTKKASTKKTTTTTAAKAKKTIKAAKIDNEEEE